MQSLLRLGLIGLAVILTAACGGNTTGAPPPGATRGGDNTEGNASSAPAPVTAPPHATSIPSGSPSSEGAPAKGVNVTTADSITVGWKELMVVTECGEELESDYVRIDFAHARLQRIAWLRVCANAGPQQGDALVVKAEVALTDAQSASLRATADKIALRYVTQCLGNDGKTFTVTLERGDGSTQSYTDGISFGCDTIASGQDDLFHHASMLVTGQKKEPSY